MSKKQKISPAEWAAYEAGRRDERRRARQEIARVLRFLHHRRVDLRQEIRADINGTKLLTLEQFEIHRMKTIEQAATESVIEILAEEFPKI